MFFQLYFDRYSEEGSGKQGKTCGRGPRVGLEPGLLSAVWHVVATWGGGVIPGVLIFKQCKLRTKSESCPLQKLEGPIALILTLGPTV